MNHIPNVRQQSIQEATAASNEVTALRAIAFALVYVGDMVGSTNEVELALKQSAVELGSIAQAISDVSGEVALRD